MKLEIPKQPLPARQSNGGRRIKLGLFYLWKYIFALFRPVSRYKRQQLLKRWDQLPETLQLPNQIVGKHWVQCGYTLGPAYCSFGCSHCYLPKSANRMPLVPLALMKEQMDAHLDMMGEGGNIQITGGDVVDAYWRAGRPEELIEVLQYASGLGLVPMLMTHGQILLEQPQYFARLVSLGGLRKLSIHIDTTMAGRAGYPVKSLENEKQLNPLRDQFVDLVLSIRKQTGKLVVAAQTVTVTEGNINSLNEIIDWLLSRKENLDVCRTISFQTEASVGRTRISANPVVPETVWGKLCVAVGKELPRDHLLIGHPHCSSIATLLVRPRDGRVVNLGSTSNSGRRFWKSVLHTFGGLGAKSTAPGFSLIQKTGALIRRPGVLVWFFVFLCQLIREGELSPGFVLSVLSGQVRGFNLVMHNFMDQSEVQFPTSKTVEQRLQACAFRGVVKRDGEWQALSMCEMNATVRPKLYRQGVKAGSSLSKEAVSRGELPVC